MKTFTTFAAIAALVSTAFSASVKIEETPCLNSNTELKSFDVEIGTLKVGALESVCGLKIVSADGVDLASVTCKAFKDAEGKDPGSADFTSSKPAQIATNPVQEGSIKCDASGSSSSSSASGTTTATTLTSSPSGSGMPTPTGNGTAGPSGTPKPSSPAENPNAAGQIGLSVAAMAVGVAAMML